MRVFSLSSLTKNARAVVPLYEDYLTQNHSFGLLGFYHLGETAGATVAVDSGTNAYNSVASGIGTGVTFGNSNHIPNTNKTSALLNGTSNTTYIQLEASGSSTRFRASQWTLNIWFRRLGTGNTSASGTGTGGIVAEPLMMKGGAESETLGVNMNWGMGLELIGSTYYLAADYEKDATNSATHPTGRNARMLDCSCTSNVFSLLSHTTAAASVIPHTFNNGDRVRFGGTATTGITAGTWYFIVSANQGAGTFQISTTLGGAAVTGITNFAAGGGRWFNHAKNTVTLSASDTGWHMATCTFDGTALKTYLDGVLAEDERPTMVPPENVSTQLAAIAAYVTSAAARTGAFNGNLQFASIHNNALTAQNILDLYNNGLNVAAPAAAAPSAALFSPTSDDLPRSTMVVQLTDSNAVDDSSVTSSDVVLKQNGTTLTQGVDYSFAYNGTNDQITLTAIMNGGSFPAAAYQIVLN